MCRSTEIDVELIDLFECQRAAINGLHPSSVHIHSMCPSPSYKLMKMVCRGQCRPSVHVQCRPMSSPNWTNQNILVRVCICSALAYGVIPSSPAYTYVLDSTWGRRCKERYSLWSATIVWAWHLRLALPSTLISSYIQYMIDGYWMTMKYGIYLKYTIPSPR